MSLEMRSALSAAAATLVMVTGAIALAGCDATDGAPAPAATSTIEAHKQTPERTARPVKVADPSNTLPGELDAEAVTGATSYQQMPILWLGTSFEGLNLVYFDNRLTDLPDNLPWARGRTRTQMAGLVYGTCEPKLTSGELSCPPPLSIAISGPGLSPPADEMELHADWSTPYKIRGVPAIDAGTGTVLFFENGVTITVHSDSDIRQKAIEALRLANADALGIADIGPGEDLSALDDVKVPEASGQ